MSEEKNIKVSPFDYDQFNTEHESIVEEIIKLARIKGLHEFANELKVQFEISEQPTFDLKNSIFCKYLKSFNIEPMVQGHSSPKDKTAMRYPIIGPMADVRKFDELITKAILDNTKN